MTTTDDRTPTGEWAPGYDDIFAQRAKNALQRRVSLGVDTWGDVLKLNWGMPDPDFLPAEETAAAITAVLREEMPSPLEYEWPQGDPTLRAVMAKRLADQNSLPIEPTQITFNGGSSLSLENVCRAVLEPGDVVITEDPSYPGTLHHYRLSDAEIHGVPVDEEGIQTWKLAELMEQLATAGKRIKVIHTIPDFQNPTGYTTSLRRRREVLALAAQYRTLVAEDVAYRELYFETPPPPSFYTLAGGEGVVQLGTFAKTWATGIRVGWVLASPQLADGISAAHTEAGITAVLTRALRRLIEDGSLDRRVQQQREMLWRQRDAACAAIERYAGETMRFTKPDGGYFLWLRLPEGTSAEQCVIEAGKEQVMLLPGAPFFVQRAGQPFLRIAFSYMQPDRLDEAIRRVAGAVHRVLAAKT